MADKLMEAFLSLLESAFTGFDECIKKAVEALTDKMVIDGASAMDKMLGYSDTLVPFCNLILAALWAMEMYSVAQKVDMIKWEHVLKLGVKYCFCVEALKIAPSFLRACYGQASAWMNSLKGSDLSLGADSLKKLKESGVLDDVDSVWSALGLIVVALIVLLAIKICGLLIQVIAYGRMFEICVYVVASPLPISFLPLGNGNGEGFNRITIKFLRSFAAVCFQGVLMIVVLKVFDALLGKAIFDLITAATKAAGEGGVAVASSTTTIINVLFSMLLAAVALVMSMTKCNSWARNILDAN